MNSKKRPSLKVLLIWEQNFFIAITLALIIILAINFTSLNKWFFNLFVVWLVFVAAYGTYIYLKYLNYYYLLTDEQIILMKGIVKKERTVIPYKRIQDTMEVRGLIHQLLNLVDVKIATAGTKDYEMTIEGLEEEQLKELKQVIKEHSEEEKRKSNPTHDTRVLEALNKVFEELSIIRKTFEEYIENKSKKTKKRKKASSKKKD